MEILNNNMPKSGTEKKDSKPAEGAKKSKRETWQSVKGIYEILPSEAPWWEKVYAVVRNTAQFYSFERIETGIVEQAGLFERAVGEDSDVVSKEMFFIKSRTHRWVLRPEGTAPVARAYLEYGMMSKPQPVKLYYFGPMFRHESPQAGRYRQLHQTGFEILGGEPDPVFDAQIMLAAFRILRDLGLKNGVALLNSIGCRSCQPNIRKKLVNYYKPKIRQLCKDCQTRLVENPFRLLDCKNKECREINKGAPVILDSLCTACKSHFRNLLEHLDELSVPYELDNTLVRGFDYYNRTVFEIIIPDEKAGKSGKEEGDRKADEDKKEDKKPLSVCGGGRYDYLMEMIGGRPTPGLGFAFGLERLVAILKERKGEQPISRSRKGVFFIHVGEVAKKKSLKVIEELRENSVSVLESLGKDSLGKQLGLADSYGMDIVLIFGQKEVYEESIILKNLQTGIQETVLLRDMVEEVKKRLNGK